jgi:hypothetical protein
MSLRVVMLIVLSCWSGLSTPWPEQAGKACQALSRQGSPLWRREALGFTRRQSRPAGLKMGSNPDWRELAVKNSPETDLCLNDFSGSATYCCSLSRFRENGPHSGGKTDQEGGLSTTDALGLASGAPPATSAGWTFIAPADTTIAAITYERYLGHLFDSSNYWSPALRADGLIVPGEICTDSIANSEMCLVGGPPGQGAEPGVVTGLSAHELFFESFARRRPAKRA